MNKVILIGNVGQDPEVKHLESGAIVAKFTLATSKRWKDREGNPKEETAWHNIEVWNKTAEVVEKYLTAGKKVAIEGEIAYDKWTDDQGNNRKTTKIKAFGLELLTPKNAGNTDPLSGSSQGAFDSQGPEDELPF
jgi:single-strand DNA-binding protein